jgi:uncharacterized protein (TIGR02271 family)
MRRGVAMLRSDIVHEPIIIGLFPYASEARRALLVLREHQFPADEVTAAFREPGASGVDNQRWFGQLRQLYHGEGASERPNQFEAMLGRLDLSPQDTADLERDLKGGAAIVTVKAGARNQEARTLLEQRGARIVHGRNVEQAPAVPASLAASTPFTAPLPAEPGHIQLFGEVLRVHKEKVSSGDVRVRKESVTHMETVQVPVTREHLVVEHTDQNGHTDGENSIRVPLSEERVHIDKDTVLREEYKVGKREITQNESVTDSVRRERLLIDDAHAHEGE